MPTYEYVCSSCQNEWEFEQSMKDAALTECPRCKQATARRQISRGTGFILKGGGWYSDLYSSTSNKAGSSGGSSDSSTSSAASASSGDSSASSAPAAAPAAASTPATPAKSDSSSSS